MDGPISWPSRRLIALAGAIERVVRRRHFHPRAIGTGRWFGRKGRDEFVPRSCSRSRGRSISRHASLSPGPEARPEESARVLAPVDPEGGFRPQGRPWPISCAGTRPRPTPSSASSPGTSSSGTGRRRCWDSPVGGRRARPAFVVWVAGPIELVCGILVMIGLRAPAAFLASGLMAFAYWLGHGTQALLPVLNRGELAALYCSSSSSSPRAAPGCGASTGATAETVTSLPPRPPPPVCHLPERPPPSRGGTPAPAGPSERGPRSRSVPGSRGGPHLVLIDAVHRRERRPDAEAARRQHEVLHRRGRPTRRVCRRRAVPRSSASVIEMFGITKSTTAGASPR